MISNELIKKSLLDGNYLKQQELERIEEKLKSTGKTLVDYLVENEILSCTLIGQAIAENYNIPFGDLEKRKPSKEQVLKIPEEIAKKYNIVVFGENENAVKIATSEPEKSNLFIQELASVFKDKKIEVIYGLEKDILKLFYNYKEDLNKRIQKIIATQEDIATNTLKEIIEEIVITNASDIHIIPTNNDTKIRLRIDGLLQEKATIPKEVHSMLLNKIKVLANLRIDDHFSSQDGSINNIEELDLRVSIAPTVTGEKVVIRVLKKYVEELTLKGLGLSNSDEEKLLRIAKKPFGMIINTGPTGSGKTTTLYTLIREIANPELNITSIEDPVEYRMENVSQIQVNTRTNLTFAKGLRTIVRQDPDIILVGEIRDTETAEIAVNAALTGHMLYSTFHANDAATAIPRLIDMEIEPYLLASTLEMVIAQRLVRKVCDSCRYSVSVGKIKMKEYFEKAEKYFDSESQQLFYGKGCEICNNTGYKGRIAIFEMIELTPSIKKLMLNKSSADEIRSVARKEGNRSMFEDGIEKVKLGLTTLEELLRVAEPEELVVQKKTTQKNSTKETKKTITSLA